MFKKIIQWLFPPPIQRSQEAQERVNAAAARMRLFVMPGCLYCHRVLKVMKHLQLPIPVMLTSDESNAMELYNEGGSTQTPCLNYTNAKGQTIWLYESSDIIAYLTRQFEHEH